MSYLVYDIVILAVLLLFLWRGASKGFVLSLCGLLAVVVAFVGSSFLASSLAPKIGAALEPRFAAAIEAQLDEQIASSAPKPGETAPAAPEDFPLQDVLDVLKGMGLYEDLISSIDKAVNEGMLDVAASAAAAVAAAIAQSVAYMVVFLVCFVLIMIAWTLMAHALDLVTRLPGLNALNKTGGALIGLVKAVIILFIAAWLLRCSGSLIPEEAVEQTHLLKFFMTTNPMTLITGV